MDPGMKKGTLYLLPALLGDAPADLSLPAGNITRTKALRYFIAEEATTARRFLRKTSFDADFSETQIMVFNEHSASDDLLPYLEPAMQGHDIGLLSEAGAPCVADPGARIVEYAHQLGIRIVPLVGPSSILLALMASGFNGQQFVFHGYLPIEQHQRTRAIRSLERAAAELHQTQIFIETPYRNRQLLDALVRTCSPATRICIAADLTLPSEQIMVRSAAEWKEPHPDFHKRPAVFLISA